MVHTGGRDLGVRLDGEQLAAGVRFAQMMRDASFDVVVGNPPYHTTAKLANGAEIAKKFPDAKSDLFAAFYVRGLELAREHGCVGLVTLSNWMFLGVVRAAPRAPARAAASVDRGLRQGRLSIRRNAHQHQRHHRRAHAERATVHRRAPQRSERSRARRRAATPDARSAADRTRALRDEPSAFGVIQGRPIVYWWSTELLARYAAAPKLGEMAPVRQGMATSDNQRFLRRPFEIPARSVWQSRVAETWPVAQWVPFWGGGGAAGKTWIEPLDDVAVWSNAGLELRAYAEYLYGSYSRTIKNEGW